MRVAPILLALFLLGAAFSAYFYVYVQGFPANAVSDTTLASYTQRGGYTYVADLRPNALYNKTTLRNGEGTLFSSLTKDMNVSFSYSFLSDQPVALTFGENYTVTLATPGWSKLLTAGNSVGKTLIGTKTAQLGKTLFLNITSIRQLIDKIQRDTGYTSSSATIEINSTVPGSASIAGQSSRFTLLSPMNLTMANGLITPSNSTFEQTGSVIQSTVISDQRTTILQLLSYALAAVTISGSFVSGWFTFKSRKKTESIAERLEDLTRSYEGAIAKTETSPNAKNFVRVKSWEDILRVADMMGRPIMEYQSEDRLKRNFYVLDGDTAYLYEIREPEAPKHSPVGQETEDPAPGSSR